MVFQFHGESRAYLINNASIAGWKEADLNFACIILQKINSRWINNSSMDDLKNIKKKESQGAICTSFE